MKTGLIVFDIDGTLTNTNEVDGLCFSKTMSSVFDIHEITTDWADYEHTTDSGILRQLLREELGKEATPELFEKFKSTFVAELDKARRQKPSHFLEVPELQKSLVRFCDPQNGEFLSRPVPGSPRLDSN